MLLGHIRALLVHAAVEELERDVPGVAQLLGDDVQNIEDGEVGGPLEGEEARVAAPAHARALLGPVPGVACDERGGQAFRVDDLDVEDLAEVDGAQFGQRGLHVGVCGGGFARRVCGIGVDAAGDVEGVETGAEVGSVDGLHDGVRGVPRVDVRAPAEGFVGEADGWALLEAHVCDFLEILDDGRLVGSTL